jgi:hypothetical protein
LFSKMAPQPNMTFSLSNFPEKPTNKQINQMRLTFYYLFFFRRVIELVHVYYSIQTSNNPCVLMAHTGQNLFSAKTLLCVCCVCVSTGRVCVSLCVCVETL